MVGARVVRMCVAGFLRPGCYTRVHPTRTLLFLDSFAAFLPARSSPSPCCGRARAITGAVALQARCTAAQPEDRQQPRAGTAPACAPCWGAPPRPRRSRCCYRHSASPSPPRTCWRFTKATDLYSSATASRVFFSKGFMSFQKPRTTTPRLHTGAGPAGTCKMPTPQAGKPSRAFVQAALHRINAPGASFVRMRAPYGALSCSCPTFPSRASARLRQPRCRARPARQTSQQPPSSFTGEVGTRARRAPGSAPVRAQRRPWRLPPTARTPRTRARRGAGRGQGRRVVRGRSSGRPSAISRVAPRATIPGPVSCGICQTLPCGGRYTRASHRTRSGPRIPTGAYRRTAFHYLVPHVPRGGHVLTQCGRYWWGSARNSPQRLRLPWSTQACSTRYWRALLRTAVRCLCCIAGGNTRSPTSIHCPPELVELRCLVRRS